MKQPKLTMTTWEGDLHLPGQYCMTKNGRTAYLILEAKRVGPKHAAKFIVERYPRKVLRKDDVIHWFVWNKR